MPDPQHAQQSSNARPLFWAGLIGAGAMLTLVLAVVIGYWLGRQDTPAAASVATVASTTAPVSTVNNRHLSVQPIITDPVVQASTPQPLVTAALPADTALAGEELDLHDDEQSRLQQQKKNLKQQVQDSETLMKLKAERIAALEAELAAEGVATTP